MAILPNYLNQGYIRNRYDAHTLKAMKTGIGKFISDSVAISEIMRQLWLQVLDRSLPARTFYEITLS
jgi:hypothetical protein